MRSTDLVQPMAVQTPIAINGDKVIPNQIATSIDTSSIEAGFLPITSQPLDSGGQAPERTDFNGMFYLSTDQRVFLQNGGFITYSADVVSKIGGYPQNAILGYMDNDGNFGFVKSLIDNNAYNFIETPSYINGQYWEFVYFNNFKLLENRINPIGYPNFTLDFKTLPENCIWLEGAEVSRTDYNNLFAIYGTTYGAGDGSSTFNLPDFRNRYICGSDTNLLPGYIAAGLPNLGLSTTSAGAHNHNRGTMEIWGSFHAESQDDGVGLGVFQTGLIKRGVHSGTGGAQLNNYDFKASRSWTGETSVNGEHTHTITSSNALVGSTSTVKTDGLKVRVYTRYI